MRSFEYRHRVGFEDTNLVGNVYFANHVRWQGRCREHFLHEHAPEVVAEIERGLAIVTTRVACDYVRELRVFDDVAIRMRAGAVQQGRVTMLFDYVRCGPDGHEELVARGEQQIAFMRREGETMVPVRVPAALAAALREFGSDTSGA